MPNPLSRTIVQMDNKERQREAVFYNAVNLRVASSYKKLRALYAKHGSWENCFRKVGTRQDPELEWRALGKNEIRLVLFGDPEYPPLLSEIPDPPFGIYFKGDISSVTSQPAVAVVGTRKASHAGKILAEEMGVALASVGCVVVSGMAFGIDAAAHLGAMKAGGKTVAVLATGLDAIYPASHSNLAKRILESGGALLSEYPPGSPLLNHRFLERNRIVSGLASAVVALEVPERSGALATARFACEQNRDLFVVPGRPGDPNYKGSNALIRAGATLITSPEDLLLDMGFSVSKQNDAGADSEKTGHEKTDEERKILAALASAGRPLAIDEIIEAATLTSSTVNQALTMLILNGSVLEDGGGYVLK